MSIRNDRKDSRLSRGAALALALEPNSAGAQVTSPPSPGTHQDFLAIEFGLPDTIFRNAFETP
jgi:hypothetical protein